MAQDTITLGIAISLSGRYALLGRQVLEGLECYIRDVNTAGGIPLSGENRKLPVTLRVEDDESDGGVAGVKDGVRLSSLFKSE